MRGGALNVRMQRSFLVRGVVFGRRNLPVAARTEVNVLLCGDCESVVELINVDVRRFGGAEVLPAMGAFEYTFFFFLENSTHIGWDRVVGRLKLLYDRKGNG